MWALVLSVLLAGQPVEVRGLLRDGEECRLLLRVEVEYWTTLGARVRYAGCVRTEGMDG